MCSRGMQCICHLKSASGSGKVCSKQINELSGPSSWRAAFIRIQHAQGKGRLAVQRGRRQFDLSRLEYL